LLCIFITAVPFTKLFALGGGDGGRSLFVVDSTKKGFLVAITLLRLPSPFGSYLLAEALLCKTSTVNLNLELLSHNVMGDIFKDWCIPQHDDESLSNPAAAWKVPPFTLSAFPEL
jgi:hypothetical protein